jgi:acyl-CoA synthetase (AMP-forming)/AMP-acid ligase II
MRSAVTSPWEFSHDTRHYRGAADGRSVAVMALLDDEVLSGHDPLAPALIDANGGRTIAFGQLADGARRVGASLAGRGIGRGDVLALVAGNSPDFAVAMHGALGAGCAVACINPGLTEGEQERLFRLARPQVVVSDPAAFVRELLSCGRTAALPARDPGDLALLFSSSGTTGLPKLACHTHAGASAFLQAVAGTPGMAIEPGDVVGIVVPFTRLFGCALLAHGLRGGASVVGLNPGPDPEAFLRMLAEHRVTVAPVTPPLVALLARSPLVDRYDLSALRLLIASAAPCAPELQEEAAARLGCRVSDCLGSTEAWAYALGVDPPVRGSVGAPIANVELCVVDPASGRRLAPGEQGELWVRGPQVMRGYAGHPEVRDWLPTGDLARLDAGGNVFLIDRLKELIKVGGASVAPAEVERELTLHPAVADAAVVGRPDAALGEVPVAYVVLRGDVSPAELRAWLALRLAPWKHVRDVIVIDAIPRSPAGKMLRRELLARERAQATGTRRPSSERRETPSLPQAVER